MPLYLIIILIIGLPALYGIREIIKEKRKKRSQLSLAMSYDMLVLENKLSIEYIDILENKVIAIDRKNKKLVLIDHTEENKQELCISLLQVASSSIIEERDEQDKCIKKIFLEIKLRRHHMHHKFCFYDDSKDSVTELPSLSRRALHWRNRVNIHRLPGTVSIEQEYVL
ncbi:hypothetical protein OCK74_08710 [Chitinophagaceae bacterium LB-8]|uniref:Uncharacterized protein n=1 Tax=Paraflavisolibacter caeni TaxID=2982496 RepID=A0A9X2XNV3_9BACT|nr:hypothetical protein [Paraflavisolibacter caeni]MCU7549194.1 hypothetical protein [Paraflavisolibacter caeni]